MSLRRLLLLCIVLGTGPICPEVYAGRGNPQITLAGGLVFYKGSEPDSLAGDMGYMMRFQAESARDKFFRIFGNFTLSYASGDATFSDSGADVTLNYRMIAGEFNFGVKLSVLKFLKDSPVQPFVAGFGNGHLNSMQFTGAASATFPRAETSLFYGYGYQAGVDFYIGDNAGVQITFEQALISGTIAGSSFKLGGLRYFIGLTLY